MRSPDFSHSTGHAGGRPAARSQALSRGKQRRGRQCAALPPHTVQKASCKRGSLHVGQAEVRPALHNPL